MVFGSTVIYACINYKKKSNFKTNIKINKFFKIINKTRIESRMYTKLKLYLSTHYSWVNNEKDKRNL